ncbi:MAG: ATP-grasp domain-containing protein [Spirochaetales bacterium]|nr:ATP-grasp domain-containing protein [Spirochaetales bacterium]
MSGAPEGERPAVLILGGGIMQLPAVRIAREMGWEVSVAALRIDEAIAGLANRCVEVDLSDPGAVETAARRLLGESRLEGVFTAGTDFSTTVAWVAERLGLPGVPYAAALDATDKARMRLRFREAGVPCPRFAVLPAPEAAGGTAPEAAGGTAPEAAGGTAPEAAGGTAPEAAGGTAVRQPGGVLRADGLELSFPVVVKPVDNMGARGVRRVDSEEGLQAALAAAWAQSRSRRAIVEDYLEGPELSLDAVIYRGRITICGVADRHIAFAPFFVEMGHTLPSGLDPKAVREAEEVFRRGIRALGLHHGAAKGDVKITPRGAMVGEIAARLSGGYMSGWTFPLASGVEVTASALRLAVGLPPGDLSPRLARVSAERAFISIPGRIQTMTGLEEAGALAGVREVFLRVHAGEDVDLPINNMGKCGNVISAADTRTEAVQAAEQAARRILVRLAPGVERTERFLAEGFREGRVAFAGAARELLRAVDGHPDRPGPLPVSGRPLRLLMPGGLLRQAQVRDWHGGTLEEALEAVCRATGAQPALEPEEGAANLGRAFWRGVLKGGVQAGVYLIDTLRASGGVPGRAWSYLTRSS